MDWHDRLQRKRAELGWSKRELHRRSGVPYDSVVKYLKGDVDNPRGDILEKLARAVGVSPLWLRYGVEGEGQLPLNQNGHRVPLVTLGELGIMGLERASAAAFAAGRTTPSIGVTNHQTFAVLIEDHSNAPALNVGDSIFCDPSMAPIPGSLVVIRAGNQVLVRRYRLKTITSDGLSAAEFVAENPNHPTILPTPASPVDILAVATHRVHRL